MIERYAKWLYSQPELLADLDELIGKTLGCWCAPRACHGDVLARLAEKRRQAIINLVGLKPVGDTPATSAEHPF